MRASSPCPVPGSAKALAVVGVVPGGVGLLSLSLFEREFEREDLFIERTTNKERV